MKSLGRKTSFTLIGIWLLAGVYFATIAIISFPTGDLLSRFFIEWVALKAYSSLVEYFIPLCAAALLVSVSFLFAPATPEAGKAVPFSKIINTTVIVLIGVLCVFVFVKETTLPGALQRMVDMIYLTDIAEYAKDETSKLYSQQKYEEADSMLQTYLEINPDDRDIRALQEQILIELSKSNVREGHDSREQSASLMETAEDKNITEFIEKAEYYYSRRDYYSAHYFANQALLVDPNRVDMKNLSALSWQKIDEMSANAETREEAKYYQRKREGYSAIQEGRFIDAYYIFHELKKTRTGEDPDIMKYLRIAEKEVRNSAYFIEEIRNIQTLPGTRELFFMNPDDGSENSSHQFIFMDKYIVSTQGIYAVDVEIVQMGPAGSTEMHAYAPFAKILDTATGQVLIMKGISEDDEGTEINPVFYTSTASGYLPRHILPLNISKSGIEMCSLNNINLKKEKLPRLLSFRTVFHRLGYPGYIIEIELINRLLVPFTFLIISFFSLSLGWVLHIPGNMRRTYMFLILPLIPFFTVLCTEVYNFVNRTFYLYFLTQVGFTLTIILLITASTGLLVFSLLILAFQTSK